jgi:hypothetical protein
MDISILGYKFNLEILILIGVVYLILAGHTLCGCCNFGMMEGLNTMNNTTSSTTLPTPAGNMVGKPKAKAVNAKNNLVSKEGFVGANTNYGQSSPYDLGSNVPINTSSWSNPDMTVVPGKPLSDGVKKFLDRQPQPVPLPEGEMLLFANTQFKPDCCPNTYSNSTGCACMTGQQYNYLIMRGGNNVPYSEY